MKKHLSRFLSILLTVAFMTTSLPLNASALEVSGTDIVLEAADSTESDVVVTEDDPASVPSDEIVSVDDTLMTETVVEESTIIDNDKVSEIDEEIVEEIVAEDIVSENEITPDRAGGEKPDVSLLREGADPASITLYGLPEKDLGSDAYGQVYTYSANGKTYTVLYIYGTAEHASIDLSDYGYGKYIISSEVYGDFAKNTITDLVMDDNIESILTDRIFFQMTELSHVRLSNTLKKLASTTFEECTSLTEITIPASVEESGSGTFDRCSSLDTVNFAEGMVEIPAHIMEPNGSAPNYAKTVNLPSTVKIIGEQAFCNQVYLERVNFAPGTVLLKIENKAFYNTNLSDINLPKFAGKWYELGDTKKKFPKPPTISGLAFADIKNSDFETLIIPEGVGQLGELVTKQNKFKKIYLPKSIVKNGFAIDTFNNIGTTMKTITDIYYAGSKSDFLKALNQSDAQAIQDGYGIPEWYKYMRFGQAAVPVSGISVPSENLSMIKYKDDITDGDKEIIELTITPQAHIGTKYAVSSSDETVVEASLGSEDSDGRLPLTLTYHKKTGTAQVTVSGGQASARITVSIKDKDAAEMPYITGSGKDPGDAYTLNTSASNAQIFYYINNSSTKTSFLTAPSNYTVSAKTGIYKAAMGAEYTDPIIVGKDLTATNHWVHAVVFKNGLKISDELVRELPYAEEDKAGDVDAKDLADLGGVDHIPSGLWVPDRQLNDIDRNIYTGIAFTIPSLRVYYGNKLLTLKKDYTLSYKQNTKVSSASNKPTVTVMLTGDYSGSRTYDFTISPLSVTEDMVTYVHPNLSVKMSKGAPVPQTPDLKIKVADKQLKAGIDYSVLYKTSSSTFSPTVTGPGNYQASVTFDGNYSGNLLINNAVNIIGPSSVSIEKVTVSKIPDQNIKDYLGYDVKPVVKLTYKGTELIEDTDYTLSYSHNYKEAGTGFITITGQNGYSGVRTIPFKINGIKLDKNNLTAVLLASYSYRGSPIDPTTYPSYSATCDGVPLTKNTDYTYTLSKNVNAGTATLTIFGKGIYEGKVSFNFTIKKTDLTDSGTIKVRDISGTPWNDSSQFYTFIQKGVTPAILIYDENRDDYLTSADYSIKYMNNKQVASYDAMKGSKDVAPAVIITGKGNYAGTITRKFTISKSNIGKLRMELDDMVYTKSSNKYPRKVTILDSNGIALKEKTDYTLGNSSGIVYTYDEDTSITRIEGKGKNAVTKTYFRYKDDPVEKDDIIPAETVIRVSAAGIGNYTGNISNTFTVAGDSIKNMRFTLLEKEYAYTGKPIILSKDKIKVEIKSGKYWASVDDPADAARYFDIIDYSNNVNRGTAKVTIRAKNGYAGKTTLSFKIKARN